MTRRGRSAKAASHRQLRVGEELRHALAQVFARGDLRDPELAGVPITVSEVRVSPDLRNATAFVLPLGGERTETVLAALGRCAPYLRGRVAGLVSLKYMPALEFEADRSFENASRVTALLRQAAAGGDPASRDGGESGDDA